MADFAIIYNPTAAAGKYRKKFDLVKKYLTDFNLSFHLLETEYFAHAIKLGEQAALDGYNVIACGGDGTCNEVLNGVINSNTNALLGFIPMGTGMDIPGAVGYRPDNIKRACEIIASGNIGKVDVGVSINKNQDKRYFLGIGSQGFDAQVTKLTNEGNKRLPGTWNYIASVVRTVFGFKKRNVRITLDDEIYESLCNLVAVGNGPTYGGWMYMCPKARVDDGLFHISVIEMNPVELLYNFNSMYSRSLHPHKHVKEFVSSTVKIEMIKSEDDPYIGQVDGEIIGTLPIEYSLLPKGYEFIKPSENEAEKWFREKHGKKFTKHCQKLETQNINYYST